MRVDLPFPSMNGWAMFISTYLAMISSKVDSGIFSITGRMASRYRQLAKRKFPLEIFKVRICPAKLYSPSNRYLWISHSPFMVPTSMLVISPVSKSLWAFTRLDLSISLVFMAFQLLFLLLLVDRNVGRCQTWFVGRLLPGTRIAATWGR